MQLLRSVYLDRTSNMLGIVFCLFLLGVSAKDWEPDCVGDEFSGVCVKPRYCFSTNRYIPGLVYPKPCTTKKGRVGVCCTDCKLVSNANDAIFDKHIKTGILWKTGQKSWDKCIEHLQRYEYHNCNVPAAYMQRKATQQQCHEYERFRFVFNKFVTGGIGAERGEFPHMALLGFRDSEDPSSWLCSGSLISERYILTAAHCIESRNLGPVTEAAFGILKRSDPPEYWRRYKIRRSIPHPEYREPSKYHDIALLETETPVNFINASVLPACLPTYDAYIQYDSNVGFTATGWGDLGYLKGVADTMQKVVLTKFSAEECDAQFPAQRRTLSAGLDHATQMCFGDKKLVRDTCRGDSGGALQVDTGHPSCISTLVGVTSYGSECGFLGQGGVYTKIAAYLPWIESVVWP